ncbi:MAG TPA: OmpA family protein, partial [Candidatus Bathyarchaeia archaeon]|nr:OmpA family protein [Candidatus Bathyarchaeia archaeon]
MAYTKVLKNVSIPILLFAAVVLTSALVSAQTSQLEGVIKAQSGMQITLETADMTEVIVLLTENTNIGQDVGAFRSKKMAKTSLIPGLPIRVEGAYDDGKQFVAKTIRFKGSDLQQAKAIQAGVAETKKKTSQNQAELEKQNAELKAQNEALKAQQEAIEKNKAAIAANSARFGQLDDWYIIDELTIYFGNGKANVDPKYMPQLVALAEKAKGVRGHRIEIRGFASSTGSAAANQKLSNQRAQNVKNILLQDCHVPV